MGLFHVIETGIPNLVTPFWWCTVMVVVEEKGWADIEMDPFLREELESGIPERMICGISPNKREFWRPGLSF